MEQRLERAWERMVEGKAQLLQRVGRHPPDLRGRAPGVDGWSMQDVVEHLILSEAGMSSALAKEPSPERPRIVGRGRWYRMAALRFALLTGIRIRAPVEAILPRREHSWEELSARWEEDRARLAAWLQAADPRILGDPRFRHPIIGWLTVQQALLFAGDHLAHHRMQITRLESRAGVQ